jgi:hypothetical protein
MNVWAVIASGPSLTVELAEQVRGRCKVIAVSNAFTIAPWADALVSNDAKWWRAYPEALKFAGRKFSGARVPGTEMIKSTMTHGVGSNSGLQGMRVARDMFGAEKILLVAFDMHGTHFFGSHKPPLKDTPPHRRKDHLNQFKKFDVRKCPVVNCTPGSALEHFPMSTLAVELP